MAELITREIAEQYVSDLDAAQRRYRIVRDGYGRFIVQRFGLNGLATYPVWYDITHAHTHTAGSREPRRFRTVKRARRCIENLASMHAYLEHEARLKNMRKPL